MDAAVVASAPMPQEPPRYAQGSDAVSQLASGLPPQLVGGNGPSAKMIRSDSAAALELTALVSPTLPQKPPLDIVPLKRKRAPADGSTKPRKSTAKPRGDEAYAPNPRPSRRPVTISPSSIEEMASDADNDPYDRALSRFQSLADVKPGRQSSPSVSSAQTKSKSKTRSNRAVTANASQSSAPGRKRSGAIATLGTLELPHHLPMIGSKPPIWCDTRQELCETLPYFKSYQGGHYTQEGRIYGYLLDGYPGPLDAHSNDLRVIISHGGGGSSEVDADDEPSPAGRTFALSSSQSRNHFRIRALDNNCNRKQPVVLIAGTKWEGMPWLQHLGVRYAVLGQYLITHCWAAPEVVVRASKPVVLTRFYARFEWVESQGEPWWFNSAPTIARAMSTRACEATEAYNQSQIPIPASLTPEGITATLALIAQYHRSVSSPVELVPHSCARCGSIAPVIYGAPLCLNESCETFGRTLDGKLVTSAALQYSAPMLQPATVDSRNTRVDLQLLPRTIEEACVAVEAYDKSSMLGTHCRACGRLSVREEWSARECRHCGPSTRHFIQQRLTPASELRQGVRIEHQKNDDIHAASCVLNGGARVSVFTLPDPDGVEGMAAGRVIHVSFDREPTLVSQADAIFTSLQQEATFQRGEMRQHRHAGRLLTQHFSLNSSAPYTYAARTPTVSFDDAPGAVNASLAYIRSVVKRTMAVVDPASEPVAFNEVLSIAHMTGQAMSWHDDGEHDVSRVVASLSFGSDAQMEFRAKQSRKLQKMRKEAGIRAKATGPMGRVCLRLVLRHGDVLIVQGEGVQKSYEHAVSPHGFRFAATARYIYASPRERPPAQPMLMPGASPSLLAVKPTLPLIVEPEKPKRKRSSTPASAKRESSLPPPPPAQRSKVARQQPPILPPSITGTVSLPPHRFVPPSELPTVSSLGFTGSGEIGPAPPHAFHTQQQQQQPSPSSIELSRQASAGLLDTTGALKPIALAQTPRWPSLLASPAFSAGLALPPLVPGDGFRTARLGHGTAGLGHWTLPSTTAGWALPFAHTPLGLDRTKPPS